MAGPCWLAAAPVAATNSPSATKELSGTREPAGSGARNFSKRARILRTSEYRRVYDHGVRIPGPLFAAFCFARPETEIGAEPDGPRLGLTVPRAVGKAVIRNRIKRRLREVFRLQRIELGAHWDIVLNPRRPAAEAPFADLEKALRKVIDRCNAS
jgi:ribonuclease P protein component